MTRRLTPNAVGRGAVGSLLAVGLLAGCGGTPPPAQEVPVLTASLDRVDSAVVQGRYDDARAQLEDIVTTTRSARDDGRITGAQASAIIAAATELLDALPTSSNPSTTSSSSSSTTSSDESTTDATSQPGRGRGRGHDNGNDNGNGQGHD